MSDRAYMRYQESNKVRKPKSLIIEALKPPRELITAILEILPSTHSQPQEDSEVNESVLIPDVVLPNGTVISREEAEQMTNQNSTSETLQL